MALIVALTMFSTTASAEIKKGQKTYLKKCKKCHGNGTKGAAMKTQEQWVDLFANGAKKMIKAHDGTKGEKYFHGKRFGKKAPHLKDFLWQYGSDSGNVPSCG